MSNDSNVDINQSLFNFPEFDLSESEIQTDHSAENGASSLKSMFHLQRSASSATENHRHCRCGGVFTLNDGITCLEVSF